MNTKIDIRLERDPRYTAAVEHYTKLKLELDALERKRDEVQSGLNSLADHARNRITEEATALLSGGTIAAGLNRGALTQTLGELTHEIIVLREAVSMQQNIVSELRSVVGKGIATDLLPQHRANVAALAKAAIEMNIAMEREDALRRALHDTNVPDCGILRPMTMPGVGFLRDNQSRIFRFLLECEQYGFVQASDLPDIVRAQIPPKAKATPSTVARRINADGWVNA